MSLTAPSTPDASAASAEESRLLESQAELEIEENPKLARQEGLAPAQPADADRQANGGGAENAPGGRTRTSRSPAGEEPEFHNEEDLPSDGRDHEGERMIEELGNEPHIRKQKEGQ
jgi:hypothetical protein